MTPCAPGHLKGTLICSTFTIILTQAGSCISHAEFRALMSFRYYFVISVHFHFKPQFVLAEFVGISSACLGFGDELEEAGKEEGRKTEAAWSLLTNRGPSPTSGDEGS